MAECSGKRVKRVATKEKGKAPAKSKKTFNDWFSVESQKARFSDFELRQLVNHKYMSLEWMRGQGFHYQDLLEGQGLKQFLELQGPIYPEMVRIFYSNLTVRDGKTVSLIGQTKIVLNEQLFEMITGLKFEGSHLHDVDSDLWLDFDADNVFRACIRHPGLYKKPYGCGALTVNNRILHYVIVWLLMPRETNRAQPSQLDLLLIHAFNQGTQINWPEVIINYMHKARKSNSLRLPYAIFISRIIDCLDISTDGYASLPTTAKTHSVNDGSLRHMGLDLRQGVWVHKQEDAGNEQPAIPDSSDDEMENMEHINQQETQAGSSNILDSIQQMLNAQEARINDRMAEHFAALNVRMDMLESRFPPSD